MTTRDIQACLAEVYGANVNPALVSKVTGVVAKEFTAWQARALWPITLVGENAGEKAGARGNPALSGRLGRRMSQLRVVACL